MKEGIFNGTKVVLLRIFPVLVLYGAAVIFLPGMITYCSAMCFAGAVNQITDLQLVPSLLSVAVYAGLMVLSSVFHTAMGNWFQGMRMKVDNTARTDILSKVPRKALVLFEDDNWLAGYERIVGLSGVPADFINNAISFLSQMVSILLYYIYVYQYIGLRALLFLLIFVPSVIKSYLASHIMEHARRKINPVLQLERKRFSLFLDPGVQSEGRIFRSEDFVFGKWKESFQKQHLLELKNDRRVLAAQFGMDLLTGGLAALLFVYLITMSGAGGISVGAVIALVPYIRNIISSADSAMNRIGSFYLTVMEYREIKSFYNDYLKESCQAEQAASNERGGGVLEVSSLCFTYPGSEREILHDISFSVMRGEKVAVVGENGAGKSTLLKILAGIYSVKDGCIWYHGRDINAMSDEERSKRVSFIFQNPLHYPANMKDNLLFGQAPEESGREATKLLEKLDKSLLEGLEREDAILVPGFRQSTNISNGQWQKIGIIRSLMKKDCDVFFFDEPTAALDPVSEVEAFNLFLEGVGERTMLIATHRLGLARKADRILFLKDSAVEAVGTHEELMKSCGEYARMYESQAQWY